MTATDVIALDHETTAPRNSYFTPSAGLVMLREIHQRYSCSVATVGFCLALASKARQSLPDAEEPKPTSLSRASVIGRVRDEL